ncbi:MAG: hypothetical protein IJY61_05200 [Candidatus Gastranaerophilales bacterium]|nr:hypothetical protein [Candidatus Gastranaerophilales bacterium]
MGYAMFAARKIMLTDSINMTNLELTKISNQLMDLADLGAAVSDGEISAFDIAECQNAGLTCSYGWDMATSKYTDPNYYIGLAGAEKEARENVGGSWLANIGGAGAGALAGFAIGGPVGAIIGGIGGAIVGNQCSAKTQARNQYVNQYKEEYSEKKQEEIARELQEQIAKMENELEKRQANLETKIQAYQQDLQAVEQAESNGIQQATPKYAGV